jgi:hypothetical protein
MKIPEISMDTAIQYRIKVSGSISEEWFSFYDNMVLDVRDMAGTQPVTTLTGYVADQAALISMLALLYDMQCPLLSVECLLEK